MVKNSHRFTELIWKFGSGKNSQTNDVLNMSSQVKTVPYK